MHGGGIRHARAALRSRVVGSRPVSGLASGRDAPRGRAFPCRAQWHDAAPRLAYRCGGSAGIGEE